MQAVTDNIKSLMEKPWVWAVIAVVLLYLFYTRYFRESFCTKEHIMGTLDMQLGPYTNTKRTIVPIENDN